MPHGPEIPKLTTDVTWTAPPESLKGRPLTRFDVLGAAAGWAVFVGLMASVLLVQRHPWPESVRWLVPFAGAWASCVAAGSVYWMAASRGRARPLSRRSEGARWSRPVFDGVMVGASALVSVLAAPDEGAVLYLCPVAWAAVLILRLRFDGYVRSGGQDAAR